MQWGSDDLELLQLNVVEEKVFSVQLLLTSLLAASVQ